MKEADKEEECDMKKGKGEEGECDMGREREEGKEEHKRRRTNKKN